MSRDTTKALLCVGGPRAGQRMAILHGTGFSVAVRPDVPENDPAHADFKPNRQVTEFTSYREEIFHAPEGDVSFWVPTGQSQQQTILMLLEVYEQAHIPEGKRMQALSRG